MNHEHEQSHASAPAPRMARTPAIEPGQSSRSAMLRKSDHAVASGLVRRKAQSAAGGPALSSVSLSSLADSFAAASPALSGDLDSGPAAPRPSAADIAERGFSGGGHEIPHRAAMEQSFGVDFSHVRAHSGASAANANEILGSHAYAMGSQVAFKTANPSPSLVAHELTHVIQQSQGPSYKSDGGIDTSGEAEADAVEAAVSAGRPAHTALRSASVGGGPGLKALHRSPSLKRGPALEGGEEGSKFGMGMSFSMEGFEKSYEYEIWKAKPFHVPVGVPGVSFIIDPNVKVAGKGAAKYAGEEKGSLSAQLGVFGEVGLGLSGGVPDLAEVYGTLNPGVEGAFTLTKHGNAEGGEGAKGGGEHKEGGEKKEAGGEKKGPASTWSLVGGIGIKAALKVGVKLAGGIIDQSFELGSMEICKLTGIYFDQTGFRRDKMGFEWSDSIKQVFAWIRQMIDKALRLGKAAIAAAKKAATAIADTASSVAGTAYDAAGTAAHAVGSAAGTAAHAVGSAASTAGHAIADTASDFGHWVTSW